MILRTVTQKAREAARAVREIRVMAYELRLLAEHGDDTAGAWHEAQAARQARQDRR